MTCISVMLVEDHTLVREGLKNLLLLEPDIEIVAEAGDADEAFKKVKESLPNVILMDIALPGVDGIEAAAVIKKEYPDISIAMLTMHVDEQLIVRSIQAGVSAYLLKSVTREQLINTIRTMKKGQRHMLLPSEQIKTILEFTGEKGSLIKQEITMREKEILRYLCEGLTNKEIGQHLYIAESTVKSHLHKIYAKIGVSFRAEAVVKITKSGLLNQGKGS